MFKLLTFNFRGTLRVAAKKRKATREAANPTMACVKTEMAQPRFARPARKEEINCHVTTRAKKVRPESIVKPPRDGQPGQAGEVANVLEY